MYFVHVDEISDILWLLLQVRTQFRSFCKNKRVTKSIGDRVNCITEDIM